MADPKSENEELILLRKQAQEQADALAAVNEELVLLKKAREESELQAVVGLVKGYSFISEEDAEPLALFLQKAKGVEGVDSAFAALESAKSAIESFATSEEGQATEELELEKAGGEGAEKSLEDLVAEKLALRKAK